MLVVAGAVGVVALVQLAWPSPAAASCAWPPRVSAHPFSGTVIAVTNGGRTATVHADDGRSVTVRGTPAGDDAATTVDRAYQVGQRYEFHPINDADPYQDNACTATHPVGAASASNTPPAQPRTTGTSNRASGHSRLRSAVPVAAGLVAAALLTTGVTVWLRRSRG
jgi:hypothetical protein